MYPAIGIGLAARASGNLHHLETAQAAADVVLKVENPSPLLVWGVSAGLGFLAAQQGESDAAAQHYTALLPSRGSGMSGFSLCYDRVLGLLAQTMGRQESATEHYEEALVFCRKAGYRPELAWTCCEYANALRENGGGDNMAKANTLLAEALAISTELRMRPLREQIEAGQ